MGLMAGSWSYKLHVELCSLPDTAYGPSLDQPEVLIRDIVKPQPICYPSSEEGTVLQHLQIWGNQRSSGRYRSQASPTACVPRYAKHTTYLAYCGETIQSIQEKGSW